MKRWLYGLAASATLTALSAAATAADLNYYDPPQRHGSAYDDPRYADLYGYAPPPPPPPFVEKRYYGERYGYDRVPIPKEPVYRDYNDGVPPVRRRYSDVPRHRVYGVKPACAPKDEVQFRLQQDGWHGFHDARPLDSETAQVKARRRNGRLFELTIDRCSGDVVQARPLEPRGMPYADRRWDRSYY